MMKLYRYIGTKDIAEHALKAPRGTPILSRHDVVAWAKASRQTPDTDGCVTATFIVDESGVLRIADRHSEHVACAGGGLVFSAGEITFALNAESVDVVAVSNQSAGYCPEPESWPSVASALDRAGIRHPGHFTQPIVFRRCPSCSQRNIVKDDWFECGVCGNELPGTWNF